MTASETQETLSSRITLLGGEMLNWSDLDRTTGTGPVRQSAGGADPLPAAGPADHRADRRPDRALAAGAVGRPGRVTRHRGAVLAGRARAEPAAERQAGADLLRRFREVRRARRAATTWCWRWTASRALFSADSEDMPWLDTLHRLRDLVKPGGRAGARRDQRARPGRDAGRGQHGQAADRRQLADQQPDRPGRTARAGRGTGGADRRGPDTDQHYAVYPQATKTSLMVHERVLSGHTGDEVLAILASSAFAQGLGGRPVLTDPRRMAREMMRHGTGLSLAPGWLFVTSIEASEPGGRPRRAQNDFGFPDALITDNLDHPYWAVVSQLARDADGHWQRSLVNVGRSTSNRASGHLQREPARLAGSVPERHAAGGAVPHRVPARRPERAAPAGPQLRAMAARHRRADSPGRTRGPRRGDRESGWWSPAARCSAPSRT